MGYLYYKQGSYEGIWRNFLDGAQLLVYLVFGLWYARDKIERANSLAVSFKVISCFKRHYMRDWEQSGMVGWAEAKGLISHVSIDLL